MNHTQYNPFYFHPEHAWTLKAMADHKVSIGGYPWVPQIGTWPWPQIGQSPGGDAQAMLASIASSNPQLAAQLPALLAQSGPAPSPMQGGFGPQGYNPIHASMPSKVRGAPLGFDSTTDVAAATQVTVTRRPQKAFRVERLIVPNQVAPNFNVDNLLVGNISQFASNDAIPAESFIPNASEVPLAMDMAVPALDVVVQATNISGGPVRFRCSVNGTALY